MRKPVFSYSYSAIGGTRARTRCKRSEYEYEYHFVEYDYHFCEKAQLKNSRLGLTLNQQTLDEFRCTQDKP
jgi:hypothetical protein